MKDFTGLESTQKIPNPERLIGEFNRGRIDINDPVFGFQYANWQNDLNRVEKTSRRHSDGRGDRESLGKLAEALIYFEMKKHPVSRLLRFRPSSQYDDYYNGVDVIIDPRSPKSGQSPVLATVDITLDQPDLNKDFRPMADENETARSIGIENKLERFKQYIDRLAKYDPVYASKIVKWIKQGGLHEPVSETNRSYFNEAENFMLLKYYLTPDDAPQPHKPGFVVGGPLVVVSADTVFVNKALQAQFGNEGVLGDLAVLEFVAGIQAIKKYNDQLQRSQVKNGLFDIHCENVNAWDKIFNQPDFEEVVDRALQRAERNRDLRTQLGYYSQTLTKAFDFLR